jgi:hypothetical protein
VPVTGPDVAGARSVAADELHRLRAQVTAALGF